MIQDVMRAIYPGVSEYILPVTPSISATLVSLYASVAYAISVILGSPYTRLSSVVCQAEWRGWSETDFLTTQSSANDDQLHQMHSVCQVAVNTV